MNAASCSFAASEEIAAFLTRKGFDYKVTHPSISAWESQTFNMSTKEQWETKSRAEVPDWRGAYYRFSIVKEGYHSPQDAMARLRRMLEKPPGLTPEDDKAFPLREGFSVDNNVYIVSCQVSMFHGPMKQFTRELEQTLRGETRQP